MAFQWEPRKVVHQLRGCGVLETVRILKQGYPSRKSFVDLQNIYKAYLPIEITQLEAKTFCELLLHSVGLNANDFKLGLTHVFFRAEKLSCFDQIVKSDPQNLTSIAENLKKWLAWSRLSKAVSCVQCVVKCMFLFKKNMGLFKLNNILSFLVQKRIEQRRIQKKIDAVIQNKTSSDAVSVEIQGGNVIKRYNLTQPK